MPATHPTQAESSIHDAFVEVAERLVNRLYVLWKKDRRIDPGAIAWPGKPIYDDQGELIDGPVALELPSEMGQQRPILAKLVARTRARALFVVRQYPGEVKAILETYKGTRTWTIPIEQSADVQILGRASAVDDAETFGLLWTGRTTS